MSNCVHLLLYQLSCVFIGVFQVDLQGGMPILSTWNLDAQNKNSEKIKKTCQLIYRFL